MATLIRTDGSTQRVSPKNGRSFSLEEMYRLVETDIVEYVLLGAEVLIICEEGKIRNKPRNASATKLALARGWRPLPGDHIVGTALHCTTKEAS